jgi:hypothetical protein
MAILIFNLFPSSYLAIEDGCNEDEPFVVDDQDPFHETDEKVVHEEQPYIKGHLRLLNK